MIPVGNSGNAMQARGKGARGGFPFLKSEMISGDKTTCKILGVKSESEGKFGPHVVVKIAMNGNTFLHDLKVGNPNLDILVNAFGQEENEWVGKSYTVHNQLDEFNGKYYLRVTPVKK